MNLSRWHAIPGLALLLMAAPAVQAQPFSPRLGYVYPAGGRQGTTFQVTVGGQYLANTANAYVSGAGVQAEVVEYNRPLTQKEFTDLREKLQELQQQKEKDAAALKEIADIRAKILKNPPNRQGNPAIAETVTLKVTMAADAEPGPREIRLAAPVGLSNPLLFDVGQLPEFSKPAAKIADPQVERFRARFGGQPTITPAKSDTTVALPAIVNGQMMPGAADRYRFQARKGQRLVVAAGARELIPYLPDAVPGWFQATLALYDAKGRELAYDDDYRFHPDPVLYYEIPQDGDYVVEIKDAIYRGRQDFVYRIALGELPFVTSIFPLGGRAGEQTTVEVKGWNLPVASLTMDAKDKGPGVYPLSARKEEWVSNHVPFAVDTLPECLEREPNNKPESAQPVTLPVIVNGRIDRPDDWDVLRFEGHGGSQIVAEVYARRLDSPLDSVLKLTDAAGKQLAFNDDHEDKGAGLTTHQADSWLCATLPADGTYYLHLGDAQHKGGPEYAYRLRLSPPQPDFELRVVPSGINVRGGATVPLTVHALRKDGFSGEIALALKDAPRGFALSGGQVPANQDQVRLTLTVPPVSPKEPLSLSLEGRATIQGREVWRPAVPAEDMMQAFAYHHLVPAKEMKVAVSGRNMARAPLRIVGGAPVRIPVGGTARVQVETPTPAFLDRVRLELSEPPSGIAIKNVSPSGGGAEIVLQCDAAKAKPGLRGNLIVSIFAVPAASADKGKAPGNQRRAPMGSLPAIPFEIVTP
jgi:hypothetical protein